MDPKIAKKTKDTLGKIITKPPLTDKLLGKPPFRFLHDITTSVIKTTGFMNGLFTDGEMNSENVKEKDSKIAFLQKAIDMVCLVTGKSLSVRPQKIVAGHEPEKTNEFLQVLAEAIKMKVNNDEYVKKLLNKGKGGDEKESRSRSADRRKKDHEEKKDKEKERSKDREKSRDRERDREKSKDRDGEKSKEREKDGEKGKDREKSRDRDRDHRRKKSEVLEPAGKESQDSQSDKESLAEDDTNRLSHPKVKTRKKHSSTRQEESPSTDEKHAETVKPNFNPRSRADRPRGARKRSERMIQVVRPGDESSDDDSDKRALLAPDDVDKKRKTGTKSRLGVRNEQCKINTSQTKEDGKEKLRVTVGKPKETESTVSKNSPKPKSAPKASPSTPKTEKVASSRRKSVDSKVKHTAVESKSPGDSRTNQRTAQATPERRRKSSFTMMPGLADKAQREEAGKENESPDREKMVNGEESNKQETHTRLQRPTSAKGSRRRREGHSAADSEEEDEEFVQKQEPTVGEADLPPQVANARRMARPSSARPAPPRPKEGGMESEPAMRLGSGRPANVIVDNGQQSDDDDNFIVEDSAPPPPEPDQMVIGKQEAEDDAEHGALVKKMLETKKEFEEGSQQQQQTGLPKKVEIERPAMSDAARRKQREVVQREIDKLRNSIQSLTRSANPLGKIMDYVQEDLDSMQKELEKWKAENKEHSLALKRERGITDRSVEPLKAQLSDLDQAIKDQLDLIAATKCNIIRNDQKIDKMLRSVAKS